MGSNPTSANLRAKTIFGEAQREKRAAEKGKPDRENR
jgi:hypothetical protein